MKKVIFGLLFLVSSTSFAQDMSRTEAYEDAYKEMPDGSSKYVGKCKTHEDQKGKLFKISKVIQKYVEPSEFSVDEVKKVLDKAGGMIIGRILMKEFFDEKYSSETALMKAFTQYVDDITIENIMVKDSPDLNLIRFNVGYGGGNGGFLVLLKTSSGYKKMSHTGDGDLSYCDKIVWKN
jgi:hypothetical protein